MIDLTFFWYRCRRMFPPLRVRLSGLEDDVSCSSYDVMLDVLPVDSRRYRYAYHRSSWVVSDRAPADVAETPARVDAVRSYRHPDGPFSASQLMQRAVSFDRLKLTNNRSVNKNGYVSRSSHQQCLFCPRRPFYRSRRHYVFGLSVRLRTRA